MVSLLLGLVATRQRFSLLFAAVIYRLGLVFLKNFPWDCYKSFLDSQQRFFFPGFLGNIVFFMRHEKPSNRAVRNQILVCLENGSRNCNGLELQGKYVSIPWIHFRSHTWGWFLVTSQWKAHPNHKAHTPKGLVNKTIGAPIWAL